MTRPLPSTTFEILGPDGALRAESWGPVGAPVVVLVHGYPDNRSEWRPVAERLADRYQVVAYDVRGAGDSIRPKGRAAYRLDRLTADFKAVIDVVSPGRPVHLVGHDWGSVQCWEFVTEPALKGRIASYVSCSGPSLDHAGFWMRGLMSRPTPRNLYRFAMQMLKSWYVYFFQLPWLPEVLWRRFSGPRWPALMRLIEGLHIEARPTQAEDGAHGVWLYRANVFQRLMAPRERHAHAPVLLLVPTKDRFVSPWMSEDLERWVPQLERREIPARHWVPISDPDGFAQHVRSFIDRIPIRGAAAAVPQAS